MDYLYVLFVCTSYIYRLYVQVLCPSCSTSCKYYIVVCTYMYSVTGKIGHNSFKHFFGRILSLVD